MFGTFIAAFNTLVCESLYIKCAHLNCSVNERTLIGT